MPKFVTNFIAARHIPYTEEEITDYIDQNLDVPTDDLAYFDVYSDEVFWSRKKDKAMVFNSERLDKSFFLWVLMEMKYNPVILINVD